MSKQGYCLNIPNTFLIRDGGTRGLWICQEHKDSTSMNIYRNPDPSSSELQTNEIQTLLILKPMFLAWLQRSNH